MPKNPLYKRKNREVRKTVLLYCEGADEKAFLGYLKMAFARRKNVFVQIKENYGYEANGVLRGVLGQELRDHTVCMYDTDTSVDVTLKDKVEKRGILCLENTPCLEAFLLEILEEKDYSHYPKCDDCKRRFEEKYLDGKKRKDKNNYEKIFPKAFLLKKAGKIEKLKMLIELIGGKS